MMTGTVVLMGDHRMFSKTVINSGRFLLMPQTSRLLYYDLGMAADDDGIVEAFTVLRLTGAAVDDLNILQARGFVTILNEEMVTHITDWKQNNIIKKDRYKQSIYHELLVKVEDGTRLEPDWNQTGTNLEPQVKLSTSQDKISSSCIPTLEEVKAYAAEIGGTDPEGFYDYNNSTGWMIGGKPVSDWKALYRRWMKHEKKSSDPDDFKHKDYTKGLEGMEGVFISD